MIDLIAALSGGLMPYILGAGALLAAIFGVYVKGKSDERAKNEIAQAEARERFRKEQEDAIRRADDARSRLPERLQDDDPYLRD
jgi:hypothetical protein